MAKQPKEGMVLVSCWVPEHVKQGLKDWGQGNLSLGMREALSEPPIGPSGAMWVVKPVQLPDPDESDAPSILATPHGVLAHGAGPTSLLIDMEAGELSVLVPNGGACTEIDLSDIAALAARLPMAVVASCGPDAQPGGWALPCSLHLEQIAQGVLKVTIQGHPALAVLLPVRHALQFSAEVVALLARRVALHQLSVAELNSSLAASGVEA